MKIENQNQEVEISEDGISVKDKKTKDNEIVEKGIRAYLHIRYSKNGKTFSKNNGLEPAKWVGQYIDYVKEDSLNFDDYNWFKKRN